MKLDKKVALVTGASRGLGAAIATRLAEAGAKTAINYLSREKEATLMRDSLVRNGFTAEIFQADVTHEEGVKSLCRNVQSVFGAIDILVVNATLVHVHKPIEELAWKDFLDHYEFSVRSPLLLAQQLVPSMKERKQGRIIHIGS